MGSTDYTVSLTAIAEGHFGALSKEQQGKVADLLKRMQSHPTSGASPLKHTDNLIWRKRLGDIRVMFTVDIKNKEVVIRAIQWRREDTYAELETYVEEVKTERTRKVAEATKEKEYQARATKKKKEEARQMAKRKRR